MWRNVNREEDDYVVEMSLALYREDPSPLALTAEQVRRSLEVLRREPVRGKAVVLEVEGTVVGFALLISFWSNEVGGEVCVIDELYVAPVHRGRGHARDLLRSLTAENDLWVGRVVALELEVTPDNGRAMALYTRLGFKRAKNTRMRLLLGDEL